MKLILSLSLASVLAGGTPPNVAAAPVVCLRAVASLPADSVPMSSEFMSADCPQTKSRGAFRYDRAAHVTRLARALRAGEIVATFPEYGENIVLPGERLDLVATAGVVRVERQVEALQTARPGERLFVRSRDGHLLSVRYEARPR